MSYHKNPRALGAADAATIQSATPIRDLVKSDAVSTGSAVALVYHGYKRTGSIVWALIYGFAGKKVPIVAVPVALAQGFGKRRICTTED